MVAEAGHGMRDRLGGGGAVGTLGCTGVRGIRAGGLCSALVEAVVEGTPGIERPDAVAQTRRAADAGDGPFWARAEGVGS